MSRLAVHSMTMPALRDAGPRAAEETLRDVRYPISRWYLRPLAVRLATSLTETRYRPWHFTLLNVLAIGGAVAVLVLFRDRFLVAAALVLFGWFCDRMDGALARAQGRQSATGAWLDGNVDELGDLALHVAMAAAAAITFGQLPWGLLIAFFFGKYLLMYGLQSPEGAPRFDLSNLRSQISNSLHPTAPAAHAPLSAAVHRAIRTVYHLPGNADVRIHLAVAALIAAAWNPLWLVVELSLVAAYYNLRWMARYVLVLKRARAFE